MEEEKELVIVESSSESDSEEGECSSGGEEKSCNLLEGIKDLEEEEMIEELSEGEGEEESGDRIPPEKIIQLGTSQALKDMLCNRHLRQLLLDIHGSRDPQLSVQRAMNIPVFVEFADECLQVCGFRDEQK